MTPTLIDQVTWYVLDAMADDWESLDQIVPHIERELAPVDRTEVARILLRLLGRGLIEEMGHDPVTREKLLRDSVEYWFAMTPQGRQVWETESAKHRNDAKKT